MGLRLVSTGGMICGFVAKVLAKRTHSTHINNNILFMSFIRVINEIDNIDFYHQDIYICKE